MPNVIPFRRRAVLPPDDLDIDIYTAVDVAIRDLRDIAERCDDAGRLLAEECRRMLERAYAAESETSVV
jgi:DNA-directed RNA polymerase